jgi:8-oxo-dGTP pyrophosphatase MutT (NUDIX family)
MDFTAEDIRRTLASYTPQTEDLVEGLRHASVLAPFHPGPDGLSLIFTKRTAHLDNHGGQISFPGGMRDPEDPDPLTTALRETHEEIGVDPADVTVWGRLSQEVTVTGFSVAPFVGFIPYPYEFKLQDFEVERLIIAPLAHLLDCRNFSEDLYRYGDRDYKTYKYNYNGDVIWGATARIVHNLISLLTVGSEPRDLEFLRTLVAAKK